MKILVIRWKSICEPDMIAAFETAGQQIEIWPYEVKDADYDTNVIQKLSDTLLDGDYDFVFTVDYFPVIAKICNVVKVRYVSWSVDCPVLQYYSKSLSLPYNRVFLFDHTMFEEFAKENPGRIYYMPLGANTAHNDSVMESITEEDKKRFSCDVSFIGSTYEEKCQYNSLTGLSDFTRGYADALIEAQLHIYGCNMLEEVMSEEFVKQFAKEAGWRGMPDDYNFNERAFVAQMFLGEKVTEQERLRLLKRLSEKFAVDIYTASDISSMPQIHYRGLAESRIEMPKIFHLSKINLNMTSKSIRTGLPQRFWDILGAGGFLLSNFQTEITEYLEPGVDLETYSSFEECEEKIAYYLTHEEERQQIALNGYQKTKRLYTYEHRVRDILTLLAEETKK